MKRKSAFVLLMLGAAFAPSAQPCVIGIHGGGLIQLGQADVFDFPSVGSVQNWTRFSIGLSGCDMAVAAPGMMGWAYFSGLNANAATGMLDNAGTASGIALQLTDGNGNPFAIAGDPSTLAGPSSPIVMEEGGQGTSGELNYGAQFYRFSAGEPEAGTVSASVQFVLNFY